MKISLSQNNLITALSVLIILLIWQIIASMIDSGNLLPGPLETGRVLIHMVSTQEFGLSVFQTLLRGITGFILAGVASLIIGIPAGLSQRMHAFFSPFVIIIRSTPVISIILLALIWFRVEQVPIFIGFLTMFPILTTNISEGIRALDKNYISLAQVYQISFWNSLKGMYLPGISPYIYSALITATGFGWRAIIIGEVLSQPRYGIGSMMQQAQSYLLVAEVIGWTLIAVLIGFLFEQLLKFGEKRIIKWVDHD